MQARARRLLARGRAERGLLRPARPQAGGGDGEVCSPAALAPDQIPSSDALAALKPLLEDPSVLKVGQNLKFDWLMFAQHGIDVAPYDDTMLMSYVLDAGRNGHGLDELAERYLGHKTDRV